MPSSNAVTPTQISIRYMARMLLYYKRSAFIQQSPYRHRSRLRLDLSLLFLGSLLGHLLLGRLHPQRRSGLRQDAALPLLATETLCSPFQDMFGSFLPVRLGVTLIGPAIVGSLS